MRKVSQEQEEPRGQIGVIPTAFATRGPKSVPRIDYERIFVLDAKGDLVGEYVLNDDSPLESGDLVRSIPVSGMRHLVPFYQGEYTFTPFRVDGLWFVVLTRGVLRIEDRGYVGTLLAAARVHLPGMLEPLLADRERELRVRERELDEREQHLQRREQRVDLREAAAEAAVTRLHGHESELLDHEDDTVARNTYTVPITRVLPGPPGSETTAEHKVEAGGIAVRTKPPS